MPGTSMLGEVPILPADRQEFAEVSLQLYFVSWHFSGLLVDKTLSQDNFRKFSYFLLWQW